MIWLVRTGPPTAVRSARVTSERVLLVIASASLHTLALPPWNLAWLSWVALAPLLLALRGATIRSGLGLGFVWGMSAIWGIGYWVPAAVAYYWQQPTWIGAGFAMLAAAAVLGWQAALFGGGVVVIGRRFAGAGASLLVAALWVGVELLRARLAVGNPWLLVGYALLPYDHLVQAADLGGVFALSFLVVLVNAALVETASRSSSSARDGMRIATLPLVVLAGYWGYGAIRLAGFDDGGQLISVAVVQPNRPPERQWRADLYGSGLDETLRLSQHAVETFLPQLIVWPESAITFFLADEPAYQRAITTSLHRWNADLLTGGPHEAHTADDSIRYFNSAFYMTRDGTIAARYDKTHLLPFGEYFPFPGLDLLRRRFGRVREFTPGEKIEPIDTRFGRIAIAICFEGIFPDLVRAQMTRGARLLVSLSNDAWLRSPTGAEQHAAMVRMRAIENRTWVIRATSTGVSAIVDPRGRYRARSDVNVEATLGSKVALADRQTLYGLTGDLFAWLCLGAAAVATLGDTVSSWRTGRSRFPAAG